MNVPFLDLQAAHGPIRAEIDAAVKAVFDRANFVLGDQVSELEEAVKAYCGVPHAVGVASGTDALVIALRALRVGPGDAVITTPFSFIASSECIHAVGARPVFCDIDPGTYNLDPESARLFIEDICKVKNKRIALPTGETLRAVLPVHLYGQAARMEAFLELAEEFQLAIIEDAAQAFGATFRAGGELRQAGAIGDAGCFSFYPSKNLGGVGDGGMIVTRRDDIAENVRMLHLHGSKVKYFHTEYGYNSRLDTLQAAALGVKLRQLDGWLKARREHAAACAAAFEKAALEKNVRIVNSAALRTDKLPDGPFIVLPSEDAESPHTFNSFNIRVPRRDALVAHLQKQQIGCMIYYPVPLHLQDVSAYLGYRPGDMPVAEAVAKDILAVPFYPGIPGEHIQLVVETVVRFVADSA